MSSNFDRAPLTDLIVSTLHSTTDVLVEKGRAPMGGGWNGQPNKSTSTFVPYYVVMPMTANNSSGPFDDPQGDWQVPYSIQGFGILYDQVEQLLDKGRNALSGLKGTRHLFGENNYKIQQVRTESIGGVNRMDQTDPPYWGQADGIAVWITKELS